MLLLDNRIHSGAFSSPLYSFFREVETLTQEDRDIMDGSTFFRVRIWIPLEPVAKKLRPARTQGSYQ